MLIIRQKSSLKTELLNFHFVSTSKGDFLFRAKNFIRFPLGSDIRKIKHTSASDIQRVVNHRHQKLRCKMTRKIHTLLWNDNANFLSLQTYSLDSSWDQTLPNLKHTSLLGMQKVANHRSQKVNYQLTCWICILFQHESTPLFSPQKIH